MPVIESAATVGIPSSIGSAASPRSGIVVHYVGPAISLSDHNNCRAQVRGWHNMHRNTNGWAGIGYHFCICHHGIVMTGRGLNRSGAHAPGANSTHIGVLIMLGGTQKPTAKQLEAFRNFRAWLGRQGVNQSNVTPHSRWVATSCPGSHLRGRVSRNDWGSGNSGGGGSSSGYWTVAGIQIPTGNPLLRKGSRGLAVERLQVGLMRWRPGLLPLWGSDGDFGDETEAGVRTFQTANSLTVDGVYGPQSANKLRELLTPAPPTPPPPRVPEGDETMSRMEWFSTNTRTPLEKGKRTPIRWHNSGRYSAVTQDNPYVTILFQNQKFTGEVVGEVTGPVLLEVGKVDGAKTGDAVPDVVFRGREKNGKFDAPINEITWNNERLRLYLTALEDDVEWVGGKVTGWSAPR